MLFFDIVYFRRIKTGKPINAIVTYPAYWQFILIAKCPPFTPAINLIQYRVTLMAIMQIA